jgi:cytochrome o ubiquinol oxidase operon protein cyoD
MSSQLLTPVSASSPAQGRAPGVDAHAHHNGRSYLIGLGYALVLTVASFWAASTSAVYAPAVPVLLAVLAIAQMGVHVAFFLQISSAPDQSNNVLALLFGVFVTGLVVFGSITIMRNLNHMTVSPEQLMQMQR